ncbi:MAG TPA: class I mannose-6-phosphate isomerase [Thermoanaerobacterales bacterium]|nr:class I mannose-6-phosphate isomerase [Thermoanaerobacterales bacterium]
MLYPYKMMPVYKEYIWGGHNLKKLGKSVPEGRLAESWELSGIPGSESKIANGPLKGHTLTDVLRKYGKLVLGDKIKAGLPILLKFIDANNNLSIQVHPDDEYAEKNENGKMGKTEMWYVIDAKPDAAVIHGFTEYIGKEKIRQAILKGKHGGLYKEVKVKKGDMVFVPAGTVHALNDGLVVAEIQQSSDLTYRLFDYDRTDADGKKRPLHIDKALDVLDYDSRKALYDGLTVYYDEIKAKYLALSQYFCVRQIDSKGVPVELMADGSFSAFMFIDGEAEIISDMEKVHVGVLETVFIPAYMGSYKIDGEFTALQIFIPDSVRDVYSSLMEEGFSNEEIINRVAGAGSIYAPLKTAV